MTEPTDAPRPATGRRALLALVGVTAAAAGVGWALRRQPDATPGPAASPSDGDALPASFWTRQFDQPAGGTLNGASLQGRPLLINFWATWCPPCVKEMPELDRFHQAFGARGWQVVGLAIDGPTPVREFLARTPVGFPIGLAGLDGTDLAAALGNTAGGLPFSVLVDAQGRIRRRKMGATHFDELAGWATAIG